MRSTSWTLTLLTCCVSVVKLRRMQLLHTAPSCSAPGGGEMLLQMHAHLSTCYEYLLEFLRSTACPKSRVCGPLMTTPVLLSL